MTGTKIQSQEELAELLRAGASLQGVEASGVPLVGLDLSGRDLSYGKFRYTDFSNANLRGAKMLGANLRHARLLGTDLRYTDLRGSDLSHAVMNGAILGETRMAGARVEGIQGVRTEVFFPLPLLENMLHGEGATLSGQNLTIPGDGIEHYRVVPAVRLVEPEGGDAGDRKLLGKVLSHKQVAELGGEVAGQSVIVGNVSYRCEDGYIGVPAAGRVNAAAQPARTKKAQETASDMDLLKDFLLSKLE